jgi:DNA topoisomerase-6 subunit B
MSSQEKYTTISPAEFFKRNPELAGFSNPSRALYQTVRELVENALDATDVHGILPSLKIEIALVDEVRQIYRVSVEDNGIGIPPHVIPNAFARVLYSSKYVLRQSRGMYGLGVKAAVLYSQMYQERALEVVSSPKGSKRLYMFKLKIDVVKNEPIILERRSVENPTGWHGTIVTIHLVGDWIRSKSKILEYIKRTYIITPYAEIVFKDPEGNVHYFERLTNKIPKPPKEVKPHPYGVDIEQIKYMIHQMDGKPMKLREFLIKEFQHVGEATADEILNKSGLRAGLEISKLTDADIARLVEALKKLEKLKPPSPEALSVIGEDLIELGLRKSFKPEFVAAVTRKPKAYQGHPFIVEVGIAYGGAITPQPEPVVLRYANKIPLIYDEGSDVMYKVVVKEIDWKRYGIEGDQYPLVVMIHLCSTKVPYKSAGKESVSDVEEIEREIKNAVQEVARKLERYISEKKKEMEAKMKLITYLKYIPEVSQSLATFIANKRDMQSDVYKELKAALTNLVLKRLNLNDVEKLQLDAYKVEEL